MLTVNTDRRPVDLSGSVYFVVEDVDLLTKAAFDVFVNDIDELLRLDVDDLNLEYWRRVKALTLLQNLPPDGLTVSEDVKTLITCKTYSQLKGLCGEITKRLQDPAEDFEYWEAVLHKLDERCTVLSFLEMSDLLCKRRKAILKGHFKLYTLSPSSFEKLDQLQSIEEPPWDAFKRQHFDPNSGVDRRPLDLLESTGPNTPPFIASKTMVTKWTRYNERHYDAFNPPPKLPESLYFRIDYSLLIPRDVTPRMTFHDDLGSSAKEEPETRLVRFSVPSPSEHTYSLTFRMPSDEWDTNRRNGYICEYREGVLEVQVRLKRNSQRR